MTVSCSVGKLWLVVKKDFALLRPVVRCVFLLDKSMLAVSNVGDFVV